MVLLGVDVEQPGVDDDVAGDPCGCRRRVSAGRADSARPADSRGVSVANPGSALASLWSKFVKSTVPSGLVRPPIVRSPEATRTRLPASVPFCVGPVRKTGRVESVVRARGCPRACRC